MKSKMLLITLFVTLVLVVVCGADNKTEVVDYPKRTIDLIVPYAPGGGADIVARKFAELSNFKMRINNISGAGGARGAIEAFLAEPDGYTIVIQVSRYYAFCDVMGIIKLPGFGWDKMEYIGAPVRDDVVFTVLKDSPIQNWESMIREAKNRKIRIVGIGAHGTARYVTDQIGKNYGVEFTYVAEDSGMDTRTALLGRHVDVRWSQMSENKDLIDAGDVKAIATWGAERSEFTPDVPTIQELKIETLASQNFEIDSMVRGFFAPNGVPEQILNVLKKEVERVTNLPEFREFVKSQGYIAKYCSSEEMAENAKRWADRYSVVKEYFKKN